MSSTTALARQALRTPRAAGVAGIIFAVLLGTVIVLVRLAIPRDPADAGLWLTDPSRQTAVHTALGLIPFAGIFFLWFMAVVRDRIGELEDRFYATVFLGSGLLFVATLFGLAAVAGGVLAVAGAPGAGRQAEAWQFGRHVTYSLLTTYSMRMAAVFVFSASTIGLRFGVFPRRLAWLGFPVGLLLLLAVGLVPWMELVFPAWALVVSLHILLVAVRSPAPPAAGG